MFHNFYKCRKIFFFCLKVQYFYKNLFSKSFTLKSLLLFKFQFFHILLSRNSFINTGTFYKCLENDVYCVIQECLLFLFFSLLSPPSLQSVHMNVEVEFLLTVQFAMLMKMRCAVTGVPIYQPLRIDVNFLKSFFKKILRTQKA